MKNYLYKLVLCISLIISFMLNYNKTNSQSKPSFIVEFNIPNIYNSPINTSVVKTDISCFGKTDGKIDITVDGVSTYNYKITGSEYSVSGYFSNLPQGTYTVTIKDMADNSETSPGDYEIIEPPVLVVNSVTSTNIETCNGDKTGKIIINATGGKGVILYSTSGQSSFVDNGGQFTNLSRGTYATYVKDANGCSTPSEVVTLTQPTKISISEKSMTKITCNKFDNGTITFRATGGTGAIEYSIDAGKTYFNSGDFTNISPNTYTLYAKDSKACIAKADIFTFIEPDKLSTSIITTDMPCHNDEEGKIRLSTTGGTGSYLYSLNDEAYLSKNVFTDLGESTNYIVKVKDENNCIEQTAPITIKNPEPSGKFTVDKDIGCSPFKVNFTRSGSGTIFEWDFGDGKKSYQNENIYHYFINETDKTVSYTIEIKAITSNACIDTFRYDVSVYPLPKVDFELSTNKLTYPDVNVDITNKSASGLTDYYWDFGDGTNSKEINPLLHEYSTCGNYLIKLSAANENCTDTIEKQVEITPKDVKAKFTPDKLKACVPVSINLKNNSENANTYTWQFGDNASSTEKNPVYIFDKSGEYTVKLTANGDCATSDTTSTIITVNKLPIASFDVAPKFVLPNQPIHCFNYSEEAVSYLWIFNDDSTSTEISPIHRYTKVDTFDIKLIAKTESSCTDTAKLKNAVIVFKEARLVFPTAFTPNDDGLNDFFYPIYQAINIYNLSIYSRSGELLFHSTKPDDKWDGKQNDVKLKIDVYIWKVEGTYLNGENYFFSGNVTLIR